MDWSRFQHFAVEVLDAGSGLWNQGYIVDKKGESFLLDFFIAGVKPSHYYPRRQLRLPLTPEQRGHSVGDKVEVLLRPSREEPLTWMPATVMYHEPGNVFVKTVVKGRELLILTTEICAKKNKARPTVKKDTFAKKPIRIPDLNSWFEANNVTFAHRWHRRMEGTKIVRRNGQTLECLLRTECYFAKKVLTNSLAVKTIHDCLVKVNWHPPYPRNWLELLNRRRLPPFWHGESMPEHLTMKQYLTDAPDSLVTPRAPRKGPLPATSLRGRIPNEPGIQPRQSRIVLEFDNFETDLELYFALFLAVTRGTAHLVLRGPGTKVPNRQGSRIELSPLVIVLDACVKVAGIRLASVIISNTAFEFVASGNFSASWCRIAQIFRFESVAFTTTFCNRDERVSLNESWKWFDDDPRVSIQENVEIILSSPAAARKQFLDLLDRNTSDREDRDDDNDHEDVEEADIQRYAQDGASWTRKVQERIEETTQGEVSKLRPYYLYFLEWAVARDERQWMDEMEKPHSDDEDKVSDSSDDDSHENSPDIDFSGVSSENEDDEMETDDFSH